MYSSQYIRTFIQYLVMPFYFEIIVGDFWQFDLLPSENVFQDILIIFLKNHHVATIKKPLHREV